MEPRNTIKISEFIGKDRKILIYASLFFRHAPNEDLFLLQSQVLQLETRLKQQSSQLQRVLDVLNSVVNNQQVASRRGVPDQGTVRRHQSTNDPQIEISEMDTVTESFT